MIKFLILIAGKKDEEVKKGIKYLVVLFSAVFLLTILIPAQSLISQDQEEQTYGIEVVSLTSPVSRGSQASITINTVPDIQCIIKVYYKSGPSKAKGLEPKNSDGNGSCTWSWEVGNRTTPGDWKIVLAAEGVGQIETYFTVTE